jgi:hypothetical protein
MGKIKEGDLVQIKREVRIKEIIDGEIFTTDGQYIPLKNVKTIPFYKKISWAVVKKYCVDTYNNIIKYLETKNEELSKKFDNELIDTILHSVDYKKSYLKYLEHYDYIDKGNVKYRSHIDVGSNILSIHLITPVMTTLIFKKDLNHLKNKDRVEFIRSINNLLSQLNK